MDGPCHPRQQEHGAADFEQVHDEFRPRVLRYLTRLAGEREAEDLAQAVMLKVSEALPRFRGEASLSTWIYRIATNTALDHLRRKTVPLLPATEVDSDGADLPGRELAASAESAAIRAEMSDCIHQFVEGLPDNYRTAVVLGDLEGFTNGEIAAILGLSIDAVKIRLHRAREKLRRTLEAGCSFHRDGAGLACERKPDAAIESRRRG